MTREECLSDIVHKSVGLWQVFYGVEEERLTLGIQLNEAPWLLKIQSFCFLICC